MKRVMDVIFSSIGIILISPIILIFVLLIMIEDRGSPFYVAERVGKKRKIFKMIKLRSMYLRSDTDVISTPENDPRITKLGRIIRAYKLDELTQLLNVLKGDMSLVGPRPQVKEDVALYTSVEGKLLNVTPGITDFSSIVFSDEGEILAAADDPNLLYNQVIRPWKSRLGLKYVESHSLKIDFMLLVLTVVSIISRKAALRGVVYLLENIGAEQLLIEVALREKAPIPYAPPGMTSIVTVPPVTG